MMQRIALPSMQQADSAVTRRDLLAITLRLAVPTITASLFSSDTYDPAGIKRLKRESEFNLNETIMEFLETSERKFIEFERAIKSYIPTLAFSVVVGYLGWKGSQLLGNQKAKKELTTKMNDMEVDD